MDKLSQVQVNRIYQNVGQKTPGCVLGTSGGRGISDSRGLHVTFGNSNKKNTVTLKLKRQLLVMYNRRLMR